jgi:hypothetical protein
LGGPIHDNIIVQMHYDNRDEEPGHLDSSGVMMYTTKWFRQHDAGIMELGVPLWLISIPPRMPKVSYNDTCTNSCSRAPIYVFGYMFHMHMIGREIETQVWRNGRMMHKIIEHDWSFDRQEQVAFENEIPIYPGDVFSTRCQYDSSNRTGVTYGGLPSTSEMCFTFVSYYPRKDGPQVCWANRCRLQQ